jgi:hypothetical protein
MIALSFLEEIARALKKVRLEAVLIGMAAGALQGADVTTRDFDFLIRPTKLNQQKLRLLAAELRGHLSQPYEGVSTMQRVYRAPHLQVDLLTHMNAVRSFNGLKGRATRMQSGLLVADIDDVIRSKRAAGRPKDLAAMPALEAARARIKSKT